MTDAALRDAKAWRRRWKKARGWWPPFDLYTRYLARRLEQRHGEFGAQVLRAVT